MKSFYEKDIIPAFHEFCELVIDQFSRSGVDSSIKMKSFKLLLNDKEIQFKRDIELSHGRYYFRRMWDYYIPCAENAGVYIFFDKGGKGLHVGKSDISGGIGRRVVSHVGKLQEEGFPNLEFYDAEYVIVIPFSVAPFLAGAFERFLLTKFEFSYNS